MIAERAHASKQTFYARFPSKEKLFLAIIDRKLAEVFQRFQSLLQPEGPVREALLDFGRIALEVLLSPEHVALVRIVQMETNRFPEIGKSFYKSDPGRGLKQLAGYSREQSRRGTLAIEDPDAAGEHFLDLIAGGFLGEDVAARRRSTLKKALAI
ncbi:TetR/AcrR family transcriptional regulator [Edaphobacter sp. HDX4]|uniref:TetR/AcrR family transcriptional regulator n=1 Tax=Edaphobacter sp. HDX4 TaxID=2794064 RepID=UPI003FA546C8